ncbi:MAG: hypothetical protein JWO65_180 [Sphingomonas bacterium]|jgi:S1-C subfamily serine protease|nr:hypothetical protein [Sphingomonas bacterium]
MDRGVVIFVAAACLALVSVIFLAEHGQFSRFGRSGSLVAIPGVTLDEDGNAAADMLIVTSLRSDSEAMRLGIRVGDHIDAVDGRPVRSVAALRAAIVADQGHGPVALHIRRGSAIWNIAIDRSEPADANSMKAAPRNDAQDPAG